MWTGGSRVHLLAPWWWALLPPLAGALILLYLLKLRRRNFVVPSILLWEEALQDLQANAPLQKLRANLLLIIQLTILLFAIFALSRPAMQWRQPGGRSIVLVLDSSASMQSTDVAPSRFVAAKREAHKVVEALGPNDRMMLVAIGGATSALTPFTSDKRALALAIDAVPVTDTRADLRGALELAAGMASGKKTGDGPDIIVISDGALPALSMPASFQLPIHLISIGERCDNAGITMMSVRRRLSGTSDFDGLITIKNYSARPRTCPLELWLNSGKSDQLIDAYDVTVPANGEKTEVLREVPANGGVLRAKLDIHDDLQLDNTAQLVLPNADPIAVTLATPGNLFLKTALSLDPAVTCTETSTVPSSLPAGSILVADNVPLSQLPTGVSALLIGEVGDALPGTFAHTVRAPTIVDWQHRHPALAHVDLSQIHLALASVVTPRTGATSLIESDAGPIALAEDRHGRRIVYLGWDLHRSDFALSPGFPIFIANVLDWLSGERQRAQVANVRTGEMVTIAMPVGTEQARLQAPDGTQTPLTVKGNTLTLDRFSQAGVYRLTGKGLDLRFAANLLDADESNLTPRTTLTLGESAAKVVSGPVRTEREIWRALLLLVLALLCLEWWVFHRRVG